MKLLYTKRSPYARKVRVLALEKGINLDLIDEDLAKKSPLLLEKNPLGKVPTLLLDNGDTVYDSVVICQYLEELNSKATMIPKSGKARYEVFKWEAMADDMVTMAIYVYMEKIRHPQDFHAQFIQNGEAAILNGYKYIETHLNELKEFPEEIRGAIWLMHWRAWRLALNYRCRFRDRCQRFTMERMN